MPVKTPREAVYYYEASNGRFRLTYFIPPEELKKLNQEGRISDEVLKDYPDGIDLGCTEPDFKRFEDFYGYRPDYDPNALQRAFFAVYTDTRNWKEFRGSGMIRADVLEGALVKVEDTLEQEELLPVDMEPLVPELPLEDRRGKIRHRNVQQKKLIRYLENLTLDEVDSRQTLEKQKFKDIKMSDGESAVDVYTKLHRK